MEKVVKNIIILKIAMLILTIHSMEEKKFSSFRKSGFPEIHEFLKGRGLEKFHQFDLFELENLDGLFDIKNRLPKKTMCFVHKNSWEDSCEDSHEDSCIELFRADQGLSLMSIGVQYLQYLENSKKNENLLKIISDSIGKGVPIKSDYFIDRYPTLDGLCFLIRSAPTPVKVFEVIKNWCKHKSNELQPNDDLQSKYERRKRDLMKAIFEGGNEQQRGLDSRHNELATVLVDDVYLYGEIKMPEALASLILSFCDYYYKISEEEKESTKVIKENITLIKQAQQKFYKEQQS